jgi:malate dehydrogenase
MPTDFVVVVTGAAGNIGSTLVFLLGGQNIFGEDKEVILRLIDIPEMKPRLEGLKMELEDTLLPRLKRVEILDEVKESFADVDCVLLVAGKPRLIGMERRDLLEKNAELFRKLAELCNEVTKPETKYLVVANPCNTNALLFSELCPNIPKKNITALSMLDHFRAQSWVANHLGVNSNRVRNVVVYGNHSSSLFVDVNLGVLMPEKPEMAKPEKLTTLLERSVTDTELQKFVQLRGGKIIQTKGSSSSFSAAQAIVYHLQCWFLGTKGDMVSMAVLAKGVLGFAEELFISLPVICDNRDFNVVPEWWQGKSEEQLAIIRRSIETLVEEKQCVNEHFCSASLESEAK